MQQSVDLTFERIRDTMVNLLFYRADRITENSTFEDLETDSMDRLCLAIFLEEEFNINIPDEAVKAWSGMPDVIKTVKGKING